MALAHDGLVGIAGGAGWIDLIFARTMALFFFRLFSHFPFAVLHAISGLVARVASDAVGYRRSVIRGNIQRSFPERSEAEHRQIERLYYRHFADITLESIKNFSISDAEARSRMGHEHVEVFDRFFQAGRSVLIAGGHFNNWELYAMTANQNVRTTSWRCTSACPIQPWTQPFVNRVSDLDWKWCAPLIPQAWMDAHVNGLRPKAVVMGFDQSPADPLKSWWNTFLHQETAWYLGWRNGRACTTCR